MGNESDRQSVRLHISFEAPANAGLRTAELVCIFTASPMQIFHPEHALVMRRFGQVRELMGQFPPITLLALLLKQFLADRSLDHPYCQENDLNLNNASSRLTYIHVRCNLCVFDPQHMCVHIWAGGIYVSCDCGRSIDPLCIEDPVDFENNVGSTCFQIQQIVKAFAYAHASLEKELFEGSLDGTKAGENFTLLQKILPSMAGK
ncbi:unnamed protein product [Sphagnum troendelagicum]|uniref:Recombination activating protein 1 n=1 Tax=Sphagnum troendelagicum TaxID=128251 RepID=A0ABP0UKE8_9BRYO